jgi:hypothetical protein
LDWWLVRSESQCATVDLAKTALCSFNQIMLPPWFHETRLDLKYFELQTCSYFIWRRVLHQSCFVYLLLHDNCFS